MTLAQILALPVEQLKRRARMGVRLFPDIPTMLEYFAGMMIEELRAHNQKGEPTRWILPVGPVAHYGKVVETCNRQGISWRDVFVFQMDEFLDWQGRPVPLDHPLSFEGFMRKMVFEKLLPELRPAPENLHFPNPFAPDRISEAIRAAGGVDTCFGGVGYHGHVAFNEPPISRWYQVSVEEMRESLTRVVALGDDSIVVQSILSAGGSCDLVPPMAVTMGMKDIRSSRKIRLFLAGGSRHCAVLRIALLAEPISDYPVTVLQGHPDCVLHTDEETAQPIRPSLAWGLPTH